MGWKNRSDKAAWNKRRSARVANRGALLEKQVEGILETMQKTEAISSFTHHEKFSVADCNGRDFTVRKVIDGKLVVKSFGVTISQKSKNRARVLHDETPQFWLPIETKPETIQRKIHELFS